MTQPPNQQFDPNEFARQQQAAQEQAMRQHEAMQQQYMAQAQYAQAEEAPKKRFGVRQIISIVVTVAVIGTGIYFAYTKFMSNQALQAGKCIVVTGSADDANHKEVDCSDQANFSYKVVSVGSSASECSSDEVSYTVPVGGRRSSSSKVACLAPNLISGVCYTPDSSTTSTDLFTIDTACATGSFKVDSVVEQANATCSDTQYPVPMGTSTACLSENA